MVLAILFGAVLGNIIRGVPLKPDGYFFQPLWTTGGLSSNPGILDWYTMLFGELALAVLSVHGALYIAVKTVGQLNARSRRIVMTLWPGLLLLTCGSVVTTGFVRPEVLENHSPYTITFVFGCLGVMLLALRSRKDVLALLGSCFYIGGMTEAAAWGLYPIVLPATTNPADSLTIHNTAAGHHSLSEGLPWWLAGMTLGLAYFVLLYYLCRGKVTLDTPGTRDNGLADYLKRKRVGSS